MQENRCSYHAKMVCNDCLPLLELNSELFHSHHISDVLVSRFLGLIWCPNLLGYNWTKMESIGDTGRCANQHQIGRKVHQKEKKILKRYKEIKKNDREKIRIKKSKNNNNNKKKEVEETKQKRENGRNAKIKNIEN